MSWLRRKPRINEALFESEGAKGVPDTATLPPDGKVLVTGGDHVAGGSNGAEGRPMPPVLPARRRSAAAPAGAAAEAAEEAARVVRARQSIHSSFAKDCDPVTDAQLAASAIYWALRLDGPIEAAAKRVVSLFVQKKVWRRIALTEARKGPSQVTVAAANDALKALVAEIGALTIARHAADWVFLVQAFRLQDAVDEEMQAYILEFAPTFDHNLEQMLIERLEPTAPDDEALEPWTMALSCYGRIWVNGRELGVPEAALMDALWKAPPWEAAPNRTAGLASSRPNPRSAGRLRRDS